MMNEMNYGMGMFQNPYQMSTPNMFQNQNRFNPMPQSNGITWVQGIEGAKAYQIPQNSNAILMDSEQNRMYIKTSDNIGMCTLRTFDFVETTNNTNNQNSIIPTQDLSQYVTKDELNHILDELTGGSVNEQSVQPTKSTGKSTITE